MRVSFLVYGVLYVVLEMVGHQLGRIGWAEVSGLDVATAVTDALLTVAVCAAVVLTADLALKRWGRQIRSRLARREPDEAEIWDGPIEVRSWRAEPLAVTAERVEQPETRTVAGNPYAFAGRRFPKSPGRLL